MFLQNFVQIAQGFEKNHYLCSGLGEKFRVADALAFISHFTEKVWKTNFGIVRFNKQRERPKDGNPNYRAAMHTPYGVEHSYYGSRGSNFQTCPLGKVHKSGHAILCIFMFAFRLTQILAYDEKCIYDVDVLLSSNSIG